MFKQFRFYILLISITLLFFNSCKEVSEPSPVYPVPTQAQIDWQELETYAFVHFGLNTFNDLEWGYGNTPASTFDPYDLDCKQWVSIIKAAGFKGVILTAKHHDGFCLWPTSTTAYSVKNSLWKQGEGDMVQELSDACHNQGLKFGIYLSPWDRNSEYYGTQKYVSIFHTQMEELLTRYGSIFEYWFDGANGGTGWYGGADEARSIDPNSYYEYEKAVKRIKELHPNVMIFGGTVSDIRWIGNEQGWAGETNWATMPSKGTSSEKANIWGVKDGDVWKPGECDVSIRPGWFYHPREDHQVKSLAKLVDIYYKSVGRNATLLMNFPVALSGKIHPLDSARIMEWHQKITEDFQCNLLEKEVKVEASNRRGANFDAKNVLNSEKNSFWATQDGVLSGELTFKFKNKRNVNQILLQEEIRLGQRISKFQIDYQAEDGSWCPIQTQDTLSTIGYKRIIRFETVETASLKISFLESKGPICISHVAAYMTKPIMEEPKIVRDADDQVQLIAQGLNQDIYYTLDGQNPNKSSILYQGPFTLKGQGLIKAIAYSRDFDIYSAVKSFNLGLSASSYKVLSPILGDISLIFDGNEYTGYRFERKNKELVLELDNEYPIEGFYYIPDQRRDASGHIFQYEFYVDNRLISAGEFSNIKNNPIKREVRFPQIRGKRVKLKIISFIGPSQGATLGEFGLLVS